MQFPYPLLKYLNNGELILLAYLINWANLKDRLDGKFFCKAKQIMEELYISKPTQANLIASLEKKGFIKVYREGYPQQRHLKLNWKYIDPLVAELHAEVEEKRAKRTKKVRVITVEEDDDLPFDDDG